MPSDFCPDRRKLLRQASSLLIRATIPVPTPRLNVTQSPSAHGAESAALGGLTFDGERSLRVALLNAPEPIASTSGMAGLRGVELVQRNARALFSMLAGGDREGFVAASGLMYTQAGLADALGSVMSYQGMLDRASAALAHHGIEATPSLTRATATGLEGAADTAVQQYIHARLQQPSWLPSQTDVEALRPEIEQLLALSSPEMADAIRSAQLMVEFTPGPIGAHAVSTGSW